MQRLLLASASPRRAQLLTQIGIQFDTASVALDESVAAGEQPEAYVTRMALEKSALAAQRFSGRPLLTADTAIGVDGDILGKPESLEHAQAMLARLAGRSHRVLSAVCLAVGDRRQWRLSTTEVSFAPLSAEQIAHYLACGESLDKAGSYAIQGAAAAFVTAITGSYSGVVGLPLAETCALLDEFSIRYWSAAP